MLKKKLDYWKYSDSAIMNIVWNKVKNINAWLTKSRQLLYGYTDDVKRSKHNQTRAREHTGSRHAPVSWSLGLPSPSS